MKKILALAMVLSVLGSALVGCGSSDTASTDAASTTPAKTDATPKTEGE